MSAPEKNETAEAARPPGVYVTAPPEAVVELTRRSGRSATVKWSSISLPGRPAVLVNAASEPAGLPRISTALTCGASESSVRRAMLPDGYGLSCV